MKITGKIITLISAQESDRERIYTWLCKSDITSSMMGSPCYPDHPIPSFEEFCADYVPSFFNDSGNGKGRNFIITVNNETVGTIGYDLLDKEKDRVVLDIWMKAEAFCSCGYGSDALKTMCKYLQKEYGISTFTITPSARNKRAIAAYKKAGFIFINILSKVEQEQEFGLSEYDDTVLMIKKNTTNQSSRSSSVADFPVKGNP
jgi:diamine N-acetyltransferase